jgi:hypothetical protein
MYETRDDNFEYVLHFFRQPTFAAFQLPFLLHISMTCGVGSVYFQVIARHILQLRGFLLKYEFIILFW